MSRLLIAIPASVLVTMSMFSFMAWLVAFRNQPLPDPDSVLRFDVVQVESEQQAQRRRRQLPEPPEQPVVAPQTTAIQTQMDNQNLTTEILDVPSINMTTSVNGMAIGQPAAIKLAQNQQLMPLHRIEPRYPKRALQQNIEGYVVMTFSIDERGQPTDIKVKEGNPRGIFDRQAIRALKQWKYQPTVMDGKPVFQTGQTVKLEFQLRK